jgi:hypothetical protein
VEPDCEPCLRFMFCTNCGASLGSSDRFCTGCGEARGAGEVKAVGQAGGCSFSDEVSAKALEGAPRATIVLTHMERLRDALGSGFAQFEAVLRRYVSERSPAGGRRVLLDAGRNFLGARTGVDWRGHVRVVRSAVEWMESRNVEAVSVLIVGDEKVIPMPCLQNPVGSDPDVDSDYPYSALSEEDPWEELVEASVAVGRLPVGAASGAGLAKAYLENVMSVRGAITGMEPIGFGAEVWAGASRETLATFSRQPIVLTPPSGLKEVEAFLQEHRGLLYFNLHGSNEPDEPSWFGESHDRRYPKTTVPEHFRALPDFNVVGVEACYGGRFVGYGEEGSCLLSALGHRTLGFVGASRIAFGPREAPRGLADIVIGDFLRHVGRGASLGEAHMAARNALAEAAASDAHSRLSILEFNLFGDPEVRPFTGMGGGGRASKGAERDAGGKIARPEAAALRLRDQIRERMQSARRKIESAIRRIDVGALVGAEIQRSLWRCREVAGAHVALHCPGALGGEVREACYGTRGKMILLQHYFQKSPSGPFVGLSIKQDLASGDVLQTHHIK